ncbi:hypothetical protein EOD39_13490 [Acipenser ruthenus]|uniref:Uncharacterized protein n=1 Tax=Acipenser ruthenus TaxID=7906 RepID=A0A662YNA6_ACIRT|nr:hypothetical protein EOD39_13490 [Acipenser ruthenus]
MHYIAEVEKRQLQALTDPTGIDVFSSVIVYWFLSLLSMENSEDGWKAELGVTEELERSLPAPPVLPQSEGETPDEGDPQELCSQVGELMSATFLMLQTAGESFRAAEDDETTDEEEVRLLRRRPSLSHHRQLDTVRREETNKGGAHYITQRRRSPRRSPSGGLLSPLISGNEVSVLKVPPTLTRAIPN